ncbi:MAG: ABC transporter ATP-binding protein [Flavobacteriaceae bacterium]|nr:ABC transporter ATP-binding protein [Flavobacteriaceae bacterium]PHX77906.1 MAG: antibiotic ABC transporter ATP-binding protein [Flavobacteriales bacterium]
MPIKKIEATASQWVLFKRILALAKFQRHWMIIAVVLTIFQSVITAFQPYLYKTVIDQVIIPKQFQLLEKWALILLVWLIVQALLGFANSYLSESIAQSVILKLRQYIYDHLTRLKLSFYDKTPVGTAVTRSISDVQTITDLFSSGVITIAGDLIQIIVIMSCMFYMDVKLTLITLTVVPVLLFAANRFRKGIRDTFQDVRNQVAKLNAFLQERITGMQIVQLFNREKEEKHRFDQINQAHRDANIRSIYYYSIFFPIVEVLVAVSFALIVWYGSGSLVSGSIEFGELTAFIMFINLFFRPIRAIADRFNNIQMGIVAADRIFKLIDDIDNIEQTTEVPAPKFSGDIKFNHVWFAYQNEEWVLRDVSFHLPQGKTMAIVGATGSGKTTIASLVNQFYQQQKGEILLDDINIQSLNITSVRQQIALVLQDVFLFSGSVKDNIRLHNDEIDIQKMIDAARSIGAYEFIEKLPGGFDYNVMERGMTLSLGQRQLVSFIRALAFDPRIILLDEATSSIDTETEQLIQKAIDQLLENRTAIVIAHRLSTIAKADEILVLEKGEVKERGNHATLMAAGGHYAHLYQTQIAE